MDLPTMFFTAQETLASAADVGLHQFRHLLPLTEHDYVGFALTCAFVIIAAGGGIGGGGILVPTYIFVLGFAPKVAIPLSNATILGSSIANCVLNWNKRHPNADRPLIDWDIMLVMEPLTIAGAVMGSFLNVVCPAWLLCVMLVLLLGATTFKTFFKGIKLYKKENKERDEMCKALLDPENKKVDKLAATNAGDLSSEMEALLESERYHSCGKILVMVFTTGMTLVFTILKGGATINVLNVTCGTPLYWILSFAVVPFTLLIAFFARQYLLGRYYLKKRLDYEYVTGDVEWDEVNTIKYPLTCSLAGLFAGLFGIGGGIVKGPLMLEMGTLPQVASATSATMILLTSSAATVSYLLFDSLNYEYAMVLFPIGVISTFIGQITLNAIVKRYKRSSLIIFCISAVIGLSTIAMGIESSGSLIDLFEGRPQPVRSFCGGSELTALAR